MKKAFQRMSPQGFVSFFSLPSSAGVEKKKNLVLFFRKALPSPRSSLPSHSTRVPTSSARKSMRVSSASAKMRRNGSAGAGRIGRGGDNSGGVEGEEGESFGTSTSTSTSSSTTSSASAAASAAARLAATAPTTTRRRRNAAAAAAAAASVQGGDTQIEEHPPLLGLSLLPGPLKKLFGGAEDDAGKTKNAKSKKPVDGKDDGGEALAHYSELPDFLKDNDFVRSWYRRESTPRAAVASLWRLHNETGNIWSHALGKEKRKRKGKSFFF